MGFNHLGSFGASISYLSGLVLVVLLEKDTFRGQKLNEDAAARVACVPGMELTGWHCSDVLGASPSPLGPGRETGGVARAARSDGAGGRRSRALSRWLLLS